MAYRGPVEPCVPADPVLDPEAGRKAGVGATGPFSAEVPGRELVAMHAILDGLQAGLSLGVKVSGSTQYLARLVLERLRDRGVLERAQELPEAPAEAAPLVTSSPDLVLMSVDELAELRALRMDVAALSRKVAGLPAMPTPKPVQAVLAELVRLSTERQAA